MEILLSYGQIATFLMPFMEQDMIVLEHQQKTFKSIQLPLLAINLHLLLYGMETLLSYGEVTVTFMRKNTIVSLL